MTILIEMGFNRGLTVQGATRMDSPRPKDLKCFQRTVSLRCMLANAHEINQDNISMQYKTAFHVSRNHVFGRICVIFFLLFSKYRTATLKRT